MRCPYCGCELECTSTWELNASHDKVEAVEKWRPVNRGDENTCKCADGLTWIYSGTIIWGGGKWV